MPTVTIDPNYFSPRDMLMLRLSILTGGVLISLFMIGDLQMVPEELVDAYVTNRAFVQLPIVFALLASSFHRRFLQFSTVFSGSVLSRDSWPCLYKLLFHPRVMATCCIQFSL